MEKMQYKTFTWPQNPASFSISCLREPVYETLGDKSVEFKGLGPLKRTITGRGVFTGTGAYTSFKSLMALMNQTAAGQLVHPVWGSFSAVLLELKLEQKPMENYVDYSFTFREADSSGSIPK